MSYFAFYCYLVIYILAVVNRLPWLVKRELMFLLSFSCQKVYGFC